MDNFAHRLSQVRGSSAFAELYDVAFGWDPTNELSSLYLIWEHTLHGLPKSLCDVGAGTGRFTIPLIQRGIHCTAVEPDIDMMEVLQRKVNLLSDDIRDRFTLVNERFEDFEPSRSFDSIIVMTDTISYVWPCNLLKRFVKRAHSVLREGGVVVLDLGLWARYEGEGRDESWTTEFESVLVSARCKATVISLCQSDNKNELARLEELIFQGRSNNLCVYTSRERILHAFTFDDIRSVWQENGFEPSLCIIPGTSNIVDIENSYHKRLLMAFRSLPQKE